METKEERESGFYWVKYKGKWIIANWREGCNRWFVTGNDMSFITSEFEKLYNVKLEEPRYITKA